jgi:hypothetical protein
MQIHTCTAFQGEDLSLIREVSGGGGLPSSLNTDEEDESPTRANHLSPLVATLSYLPSRRLQQVVPTVTTSLPETHVSHGSNDLPKVQLHGVHRLARITNCEKGINKPRLHPDSPICQLDPLGYYHGRHSLCSKLQPCGCPTSINIILPLVLSPASMLHTPADRSAYPRVTSALAAG